jgi:hypothetical protein
MLTEECNAVVMSIRSLRDFWLPVLRIREAAQLRLEDCG